VSHIGPKRTIAQIKAERARMLQRPHEPDEEPRRKSARLRCYRENARRKTSFWQGLKLIIEKHPAKSVTLIVLTVFSFLMAMLNVVVITPRPWNGAWIFWFLFEWAKVEAVTVFVVAFVWNIVEALDGDDRK